MAGILALPSLFYLPGLCQWRHNNRLFHWGLQLQVQLQTLTGIPLHQGDIGRLITILATKVRLFSYNKHRIRIFFKKNRGGSSGNLGYGPVSYVIFCHVMRADRNPKVSRTKGDISHLKM